MMDDITRHGVPIDRGWSWIIVGASGVSVFIMVGMSKSLGIVLVEMSDYFGGPRSLVYLVIATSSVLFTICAPLALVLGEVFTRRNVIMIGTIVAFIGMSLGSLMYSIEFVVITFGIGFGIGNGFLYGNVLVTLGTYFCKRRSIANGLALSGGSLGVLVLPPLFQALLDKYHVSGTLLIMSAIYLQVLVCGALFRPMEWFTSRFDNIQRSNDVTKIQMDTDCHVNANENNVTTVGNESIEDGKLLNDENVNPGDIKADDSESSLASLDEYSPSKIKSNNFPGGEMGASTLSLEDNLECSDDKKNKISIIKKLKKMFDLSILKNHVCQLLLLVCVFAFFGYFNFILFLPAIATDRGIVAVDRAWLVSACGMADLVGRAGTGFIADLNLCQRYYFLIVAQICLGIDMITFSWSSQYWVMIIQCVIYGLGSGAYVSVLNVVVIDFLGLEKMPKALAVILLLQGTCAAIGQILLASIRDRAGSYVPVFILLGSSSLISSIILLVYPVAKRWEHNRVTRNNDVTTTIYDGELVVFNPKVIPEIKIEQPSDS